MKTKPPPNNAIARGLKNRPRQRSDADRTETFFVLIPCQDEKRQIELLNRFLREGIPCRAVVG